ncbi:hypothetical protein DSECCO2_636560 [anaerobic digester metagenome]
MGFGQMEPRLVALCLESFEMLAAGQAALMGGLLGFGKPLFHDLPQEAVREGGKRCARYGGGGGDAASGRWRRGVIVVGREGERLDGGRDIATGRAG